MYRQFAKPPGQTPGEYLRDYPRTTTVDGNDKRYGKLKAPIGEGLFAAYDPLDMKTAKYLIVTGSDYLYTPRSLFWPDVIFLTAPKLDWGQTIYMMISVRRVLSMEPQVLSMEPQAQMIICKAAKAAKQHRVDPEQRGHRKGDNDIALDDG